MLIKDIPGHEGRYAITEEGEVYSYLSKKVLKNRKGNYLGITLCNNGYCNDVYIHKLVALTFLDNKDNLEQVNHKDGNKMNNHVTNLEWCSRSYNAVHYWNELDSSNHQQSIIKSNMARSGKGNTLNKSVRCVSTGEIFYSITQASNRYAVTETAISNAINGRSKTCKQLIWEYYNE